MKFDERTLNVLTRLRGHDFKPFVDWLKASRQETIETLVLTTNPEYKTRLQGKAEQLKEIIDSIEKSGEIEKKLAGQAGPRLAPNQSPM